MRGVKNFFFLEKEILFFFLKVNLFFKNNFKFDKFLCFLQNFYSFYSFYNFCDFFILFYTNEYFNSLFLLKQDQYKLLNFYNKDSIQIKRDFYTYVDSQSYYDDFSSDSELLSFDDTNSIHQDFAAVYTSESSSDDAESSSDDYVVVAHSTINDGTYNFNIFGFLSNFMHFFFYDLLNISNPTYTFFFKNDFFFFKTIFSRMYNFFFLTFFLVKFFFFNWNFFFFKKSLKNPVKFQFFFKSSFHFYNMFTFIYPFIDFFKPKKIKFFKRIRRNKRKLQKLIKSKVVFDIEDHIFWNLGEAFKVFVSFFFYKSAYHSGFYKNKLLNFTMFCYLIFLPDFCFFFKNFNFFFKNFNFIKYNNIIPAVITDSGVFPKSKLSTLSKSNNVLLYYLLTLSEFFFNKPFIFRINFFKKIFNGLNIQFFIKKIYHNFKWTTFRFKRGLYLSEIIKVLFLSFLSKDSTLFLNWFIWTLMHIPYKDVKPFLYFLKVLIKNYLLPKFSNIFNIKGFVFDIRGKVGVTGDAKKRHTIISWGQSSFSSKELKLSLKHGLVYTRTGVMGVTVIITF